MRIGRHNLTCLWSLRPHRRTWRGWARCWRRPSARSRCWGRGWSADAVRDIRAFVEAWDLPTGTSFRAKDRLDNAHPNYIGDFGIGIDPKLGKRLGDCDLLLVVGPRLGEMTTGGYARLSVPNPRQTLVHIHPGAEELNRVYQADLAINAGMTAFAAAAKALTPRARRVGPPGARRRAPIMRRS